jgi:hypothetical protein
MRGLWTAQGEPQLLLPDHPIVDVRKTGPRSNKIKNKCRKQKQKQKTHNTRETQIYMVHPVWATSTREIARSFLYYYPANEGIQPTAKNPL